MIEGEERLSLPDLGHCAGSSPQKAFDLFLSILSLPLTLDASCAKTIERVREASSSTPTKK